MRAAIKDGQSGRNPIKEQLRELFSELDQYNQEKKDRFAEIENINKKLNNTNRDLEKVQKGVHPVYNDETKLERGVRELEHRLQTNNWSKGDEARLIKEIEQVKESRPVFEKIEQIKQQIGKIKQERE